MVSMLKPCCPIIPRQHCLFPHRLLALAFQTGNLRDYKTS